MATARVREALEAERVQEEVLALTRGEPARPVTVAMAMAVILMTPGRIAGAARVPAARRTTSPPRLDGATTSARETEAERAAMSANMDLSSTHPFTQPPAAEFALPSLNLFLWISTKKRSARWVMGVQNNLNTGSVASIHLDARSWTRYAQARAHSLRFGVCTSSFSVSSDEKRVKQTR